MKSKASCLIPALLAAFLYAQETMKPSEKNLAFPEPIASWDAPEKNRQREAAGNLVKAIKSSLTKGEKMLRVPPGDYRFDTEALPGLVF